MLCYLFLTPSDCAMSYKDRHDFRAAVIQVAKSVDPSIVIDENEFDLMLIFKEKDYLGVLGVATTLVKALLLMEGVDPCVVDNRDEHALQFTGPDQLYIAVMISPLDASLFVEDR